MTPKEIRDVSFPGSVRGYDRAAVDAYVRRVNRVIAELEMASSPKAAVRHALEQVGEQTSGILQRAREAAEEITASARQEAEAATALAKAEAAELVVDASTRADRTRAEAEELTAQAKREADGILVAAKAEAEKILARAREEIAAEQKEAEARLRALHADTESVQEQREELLDGVRGLAERLEEVAVRAAARYAPQETPEPEPDDGAAEEAEPAGQHRRARIEAVPEPEHQADSS
ncbi:MAG TPA: DivIVA domain-containing protein [Gaiellaceae bacterium]